MDVDDPPREPIDDLRREDLHVASHHDQLDVGLLERVEQRSLLGRLVNGVHRQMEERNPVVLGDLPMVLVIRDHDGHVGRQLAEPNPRKEVEQAVALPRNQQGDPCPLIGLDHLPLHVE